jgi:hypothetical protein
MFTGAVVNGTCIDCNGENFRPYSEGGVSICAFDKTGQEVAAMAFKQKNGCSYPDSIKFVLQRTCVSQSKNNPFSINLIYSATYCGEEKTVIAGGGGTYTSEADGKYSTVINPYNKWKYIVKP